jgi:hypothetical protein
MVAGDSTVQLRSNSASPMMDVRPSVPSTPAVPLVPPPLSGEQQSNPQLVLPTSANPVPGNEKNIVAEGLPLIQVMTNLVVLASPPS